ncbi:MAG: hypothetical protein J2P36_27405, partial [Ktedonobacteraceae bacterium]|nr:hypothetical protein [Ktedonobacteraceae bacterium]
MSTDEKKKVILELTECEAQLLLLVLKEADDALCNRGSTEFDFAKLVPDLEARQAFMKEFERGNGTPEKYEEDLQDKARSQFPIFQTSFAASHFLDQLYVR